MTKLFNKKDSSVDLSYSHLVSNEIKWEDFLVDDIEKKLKVVKQAKTDGSNNIPSSSTNNLSNCETKIKSQANNYISRIQKIGTKFFGELKEQLEYLFPLLRTNQFTHFARDLNSGLEKIISSSKNKLEQHRKTLKEHLETLTQFKKNNELSEEARCPTKDEIIKSTLLIIIMFIFELAVNSGILAEALDDGHELKDIKYVLVDEFQDISPMFYDLVNAARQKSEDLEFFCVGDNLQAINSFAGSDLVYFEQFQNEIFSKKIKP
jgi:ATP-dependent exoDNAse (exonuclease V) beta subunit